MSEIDRLLEHFDKAPAALMKVGNNPLPVGQQLWMGEHYAFVSQAATTIRNLLARVDELEGALEPFANAARTLSEVAPDGIDDELTVIARIDVMPDREERLYTADFTRAARALKGKDQDHG